MLATFYTSTTYYGCGHYITGTYMRSAHSTRKREVEKFEDAECPACVKRRKALAHAQAVREKNLPSLVGKLTVTIKE